MSDYKLGKTAATRPHGLRDLVAYSNGPLPTPPPSASVPSLLDWGMLGNGPDPSLTVHDGQPVGDCVIAGAGHVIAASNVEVQRLDAVPTSNEAVEQYLTLTGGQDVGLNESDTLSVWRNKGLFGNNRISAYVPVETDQLAHVQASVAFYGACLLGVQLPDSAEQQFGQGQPWTVVPGAQVIGGHCIVVVGYSPEYLYAVTWGSIAPLSYRWFQEYCDEAYCLISQEVAEAGAGPDGILNLEALQHDLDAISD